MSGLSGTTIDLRHLSTISRLTHAGVDGVEDNIEALDDNASMKLMNLDYFNVVERNEELCDEAHVAVRTRLNEFLDGHLVMMFDVDSAKASTRFLLSGMSDDSGPTDIAESAIKELGNMVLSGFIDGFADNIQHSLGYQPPTLVSGATEREIVTHAARLDENPFAITFDVELDTGDEQIPITLYLIPDLDRFAEAVRTATDA